MLVEIIGATVGLIMRVFYYVSGRRKYWKDDLSELKERKNNDEISNQNH